MRRRSLSPLVIAGFLIAGTVAPAAAQVLARPSSVQEVATRYFAVLNAGMMSGDFSALATVYAPDATLTQSTPKGVTKVFHGLAALTGFYQKLRATFPGTQWTTVSWHSPVPTVAIYYERAGTPSMAVPARCAHTVVVQNGKITSMDWVTYYPGKK